MPKYVYTNQVPENPENNDFVEEINIFQHMRSIRNQLLSESDYIATYDVWTSLDEELRLKWSSYRQSLRDVPQQEDFPNRVIWPIKPTDETVDVDETVS
jgi:hypothetical protein